MHTDCVVRCVPARGCCVALCVFINVASMGAVCHTGCVMNALRTLGKSTGIAMT